MPEIEPNTPQAEHTEQPLGQEAAAAILDLWATTAGNPDIFGPGTNVEDSQPAADD